MHTITIVLGVGAFAFGLYMIYLRSNSPTKCRKLEAMKKFWGKRLGTIINFVSYSLVPIGVGVALIIGGRLGMELF